MSHFAEGWESCIKSIDWALSMGLTPSEAIEAAKKALGKLEVTS